MAFLVYENNQIMNHDNEIVRIALPILKRNIKFILMTFFAIIASVYATLLYLTYQYNSSALLLVSLGRENTQVPLTVENGGYFSTGVKKEEINSYVNLLSSLSLIQETVDKIGVERFKLEGPMPENLFQTIKYYAKKTLRWGKDHFRDVLIFVGLKQELADRDLTIKMLKKSLIVVREGDSNVIRITMTSPDPYLSKLVVEQLIELFEQKHVNIDQFDSMLLAFKNQTDFYKKQLVSKQQEMEAIKAKWNILSVNEQRTVLVGNLQEIKININKKLSLKEQLLSENELLVSQLKSIPKFSKQAENYEHNPSSFVIKEELVRLRIKRAELMKLYKNNSKIIEVIDQKISELVQLSKTESAQLLAGSTIKSNPLFEKITMKIKSNQVEIVGIESSIKQDKLNQKFLEREIEEFNKGSMLLNMAKLEYNVLEKKYTSNADRFEQVKVEQELDKQNIANVSLLAAPTLAFEPVKPNKLMLMVIGIIAGFIASIGLALVKEWFSLTVYDENDVNTILGVNYLGDFNLNNCKSGHLL